MPQLDRRIRERLREAVRPCHTISTLFRTVDLVIRPAMRADGVVWSTVDPATSLNTSCAMLADIGHGQFEVPMPGDREQRLFELEWAESDIHSFTELIRTNRAAAALRHAANPMTVTRYRELLHPNGVHDELRVICATDGVVWGTVVLYRLGEPAFDDVDEQRAASWAPIVARAIRAVMLRAVCDVDWTDDAPGVLCLDADGRAISASPAAARLLGDLTSVALRTILSNIAVRANEDAGVSLTAEIGGQLVQFHAAAATETDTAGLVVVVGRPHRAELAPIVLHGLGLTPREREVTELLLQGFGRKEISARLGTAEDTVGDQIKSIYLKADVHSRAGLCARIFGDYYAEPRQGRVMPSPFGHFTRFSEPSRSSTRAQG